MAQVVQLQCPHCRNALRVPADWAEQPMRCKFCQQVFQAHRKAHSTAAENGKVSQPPAPHAAPGGFSSRPLTVAALVIVGAGVAALAVGVVLGPTLRSMFKAENASRPVAPIEEKKANAAIPPAKSPNPVVVKEITAPEPPTRPPVSEKPPPDIAKKSVEKEKKRPEVAKPPPETEKLPPEEKQPPRVAPAVRFILSELQLLPPATGGKATVVDPASLPEFLPEKLEAYAPDYKSILDFKDKETEFPLRAALAKTIQTLKENVSTTKMRIMLPGNVADKQLLNLKNQVKAEQESVAQKALVLKDLVKELLDIGEKHRAGESKHCQVLFDYALLRLKARIVFVVEYNFNLAQIRTDNLAKLEPEEKLYRLVAQEKVTANEAYIKQYVKDLKKGWTELAKNHPDTPWAVLAPRELEVRLGLSWQPAKQ